MTQAIPPSSVQAAAAVANKVGSAKNKHICLDCQNFPELQAVILFPSLGTPFIAPASEKKIRLFLITEDKALDLFGVNKTGEAANLLGADECDSATPPLAWYFLHRQLRLTPFAATAKTSLQGGGLYSSEGAAMAGISAHYLGEYGGHEPGLPWEVQAKGGQRDKKRWSSGRIVDIEGNILGTMRPSAVDFFINAKAAFGPISPAYKIDPKKADVSNKPLRHLFQVDLDIAGLAVQPTAGQCFSLAWMVKCVYKDAQQQELVAKEAAPLKRSQPFIDTVVSHWEHQDKLIFDFLHMMRKNKQHFWEPFAFDVDALVKQGDLKAASLKTEAKRLKAYHPVMFSSKDALHIGHLSDVHVSSRIFGLQKSRAEVVPGVSGPIGAKMCNSFNALKELFDQMHSHKADAIFLTGDLIDFNHNLDPTHVPEGAPKDQWGAFDLNNFFDYEAVRFSSTDTYPRGLDDMLAYSLVVNSCSKNCPVLMTTGNHEAYDVPYGISPRANHMTAALAIAQAKQLRERRSATNQEAKERPERLETQAVVAERAGDANRARNLREEALQLRRQQTRPEDPAIPQTMDKTEGVLSDRERDARTVVGEPDPNDPGFMRVNEGIPADHNLTIYESCLAYGPSFATVLKPWNYLPANFDWFFMIFTPLADFQLRYGKSQCLIGLDWGETETMVNLDVWTKAGENEVAATLPDGGMLAKNLFGLPRADKSLSEHQRALISNALRTTKKNGGKNVLFSHFTLVNFDGVLSMAQPNGAQPYQQPVLSDGWFNDFNRGTFSLHRKWLFDLIRGNDTGKLHYTLAGHSHRAGAYSVNFENTASPSDQGKSDPPWRLTLKGYEPGTPQDGNANWNHARVFQKSSADQTRILVSSCGGPIGWQNHEGELKGRNLKAPSGTLLKTNGIGADECRRIITQHPTTKPRFCVALDYLCIDAGVEVITWFGVFMRVSGVQSSKPFIDKLDFFVVEQSGKSTQFSVSLRLVPRSTKKPQEPGKPTEWLYETEFKERNKFREILSSDTDTAADRREGGYLPPKIFARVSFNNALANDPLYAHYQFDPWFFPVERRGLDQFVRVKGTLGELPDFDWLYLNSRYQYKFSSLRNRQ